MEILRWSKATNAKHLSTDWYNAQKYLQDLAIESAWSCFDHCLQIQHSGTNQIEDSWGLAKFVFWSYWEQIYSFNSQNYKGKNLALFSTCFDLKDSYSLSLSFASKTQNNNLVKSCCVKKVKMAAFSIKMPLQEKNFNYLIH